MEKVFKHNGFKYQKEDTDLFFFLKNNHGKYIGITVEQGEPVTGLFKNGIGRVPKITEVKFTSRDKAFLFQVNKEIFNEKGFEGSLEWIKTAVPTDKKNYSGFKPEIVEEV